MISSECSSHFIAAYHDLQRSSWEANTNSIDKQLGGVVGDDGAIRKQSIEDVLNSNVLIKNIDSIPVITGDLRLEPPPPYRKERSHSVNTNDVFDDSDDETSSRKDQPLASCDVPTFWKKDTRRTSINADFLSPVRLNRLDRSHRRASLNPEGFQGLRQLSAKLQDKRSNAISRSANSVVGFDSEYGGSQSNDSDNESEEEDQIDLQALTPESNALLQRRRRLSCTDTFPDRKMLTSHISEPHQLKNGTIKSSFANRRMSVDAAFLGVNNKAEGPHNRQTRRLSMISQKTNLPKIEAGYLVNQSNLKTGSIRQVSERRRSVSPSNFSDSSSRGVRVNRPLDGHARRASRMISKAEQDLIEKELKFLGITKKHKDPLADIKKCRYLRINHDPENDDKCPCNKCEKDGSF